MSTDSNHAYCAGKNITRLLGRIDPTQSGEFELDSSPAWLGLAFLH
jgi:hypothetical protein